MNWGDQLNGIWDALVAYLTRGFFDPLYYDDYYELEDTWHVVKGLKHPQNMNPRIYVVLGPSFPEGGKTATTTWWLSTFYILIYYTEGDIAEADEMVRQLCHSALRILIDNRQLDNLVATSIFAQAAPMEFQGYERANVQINLIARWLWEP